MLTGIQYRILKRISPRAPDCCSGSAYEGKSKLAVLMGDEFFTKIAGKVTGSIDATRAAFVPGGLSGNSLGPGRNLLRAAATAGAQRSRQTCGAAAWYVGDSARMEVHACLQSEDCSHA